MTTQSGPGFGDKSGAKICLRTSYNSATFYSINFETSSTFCILFCAIILYIVCIKNLWKKSKWITIVWIRSFCERMEGYIAASFRSFLRSQNDRIWTIVIHSLFVHKFLIQTIVIKFPIIKQFKWVISLLLLLACVAGHLQWRHSREARTNAFVDG